MSPSVLVSNPSHSSLGLDSSWVHGAAVIARGSHTRLAKDEVLGGNNPIPGPGLWDHHPPPWNERKPTGVVVPPSLLRGDSQ